MNQSYDRSRAQGHELVREVLSRSLSLGHGEIDALLHAFALTNITAAKGVTGDSPEAAICVACEGWLVRTVTLADGRRQITDFVLPGDIVYVGRKGSDGATHHLTNLTPASIATMSSFRLQALRTHHPALALKLHDEVMRAESRLADQVLRLGRLGAYERIAHLLLDLLARLRRVGLATEPQYSLPVTQEDLSDALGLSAVHLNRVLRAMARDGLVEIQGRAARTMITVLDVEYLADIAMYDAGPGAGNLSHESPRRR
jgi:CRP-like cAMP-binding protein